MVKASGPSSSFVWNPRVFADDARGWQCPFVLCLHPQGCLRSFPGENARSWEALGEARPGQSSLSAGALRYRAWVAFLPRRKHLLISWLQSLSAVISEPKKIKSVTVSIVSPSIYQEVMGLDAMILVVGFFFFFSIEG